MDAKTKKILTKLGKEKVELGINDYKKYEKELFVVNNDLRELVSEFLSMKKQILDVRSKANKMSLKSSAIRKEALKIFNDDSVAAKQLGIDAGVFFKAYREVDKNASENERIAERIIQQTSSIR
jgi:predicted  nucleic acid-binding Zn-ribbon protein